MSHMPKEIPSQTIHALARSIFKEASSYGFRQVDIIRLVNDCDLDVLDFIPDHESEQDELNDGH